MFHGGLGGGCTWLLVPELVFTSSELASLLWNGCLKDEAALRSKMRFIALQPLLTTQAKVRKGGNRSERCIPHRILSRWIRMIEASWLRLVDLNEVVVFTRGSKIWSFLVQLPGKGFW